MEEGVIPLIYKDYDLSKLTPGEGSRVLQKKNTLPELASMYTLTRRAQLTAPDGVYLQVCAYALDGRERDAWSVPERDEGYQKDGVFSITRDNQLYLTTPVDSSPYEVTLTIRSFDTSFKKAWKSKTNRMELVDGVPSGVPLFLQAQLLSGELGFSKPFILGDSQVTIEGHHVPVAIDAMVLYTVK